MLTLRHGETADAAGIAVVHVDAWRAAYAGLIDDAVLAAQSVDARTEMWSTWIERSLAGESTDAYGPVPHRLVVVERGDRIVGWATFGGGRDADAAHMGELAGLYVHPTAWSQGAGHALIRYVENELRSDGWMRAYAWVLNGNARAIRFYEAHGWSADGAEKIGQGGSVQGVHEVRHVRDL